MTAAERIERVVTGVVRQAMRDAGERTVVIDGDGADARLLQRWCHGFTGARGLELQPANKTALLLGENPRAAVLPLGDLYYTEVRELAGGAELPSNLAELAELCDGSNALDLALRNYFDARMTWERATLHLNPRARDLLKQRLDAARFRRRHIGLVPKLGARTLGIDLYA